MTKNAAEEEYTTNAQVVIEAEERRIKQKPLIGLALSGGGIRSASFALGVLQALAAANVLRKVDYLSTVSGGGYIGSSLTWWLSQKKIKTNAGTEISPGTEPHNFPFSINAGGTHAKDDLLIRYFRYHGNYLLPGGSLGAMSLAAIVLRIVIVSLIVYISILSLIFLALLYVFEKFEDHLGNIPMALFAPARDWLPYFPSGPIARWLLLIGVCLAVVFVICSLLYSVFTLLYQILQMIEHARNSLKANRWTVGSNPIPVWSSRRYRQRTDIQGYFGYALTMMLASFVLAFIPTEGEIAGKYSVPAIAATVLIGTFITFWRGRTEPAETLESTTGVRQLIGCCMLLNALLLSSYTIAFSIYNISDDYPAWFFASFGALASIAFFLGLFVNVNYLGIHRMYRDRLMELFMPSLDSVQKNSWNYALEADTTPIENMCLGENARPYHIINTNVVLVDSKKTKYKGRGGDSFILSPLYCGSEATGWVASKVYMKMNDPGMTLATAMAISGAAANPNTGVAGAGFTRNRIVSTLMSLLNLRLGHWAPHPDLGRRWPVPPNFILPGITSGVLAGRLAETSKVVDLTDGGHFDNLGVYELIRRKLQVIIVSDATCDPENLCYDLAVMLERVRVDFGARIEFPEEEYGLASLRPSAQLGAAGLALAKNGFAVGRIRYGDGSAGILLYLKTTLTADLSHEIFGYRSAHPAFPDEPTSDQFFHEAQFEAYRELGYSLAAKLIEANEAREAIAKANG
ncbi:hypothetical protein ILFOPFJJ_04831 [Ensifer psoraleae]|uniref:patatin-like phospholipase family protein n=1 Tax=Sinorhizobium psoraleae TaxID=520838 RepID=UPI00156A38FD|nr:patatin-like phospholipase family protein [Sinorhizobium psoraleae]NRP73913.1 hypothetical protein [Sinorhizobium psoraleae]